MKGFQPPYSFHHCFRLGVFLLEQLVFPSKCLKCGVYLSPEPFKNQGMDCFFCGACFSDGITPVEPPFCTVCGKMFKSRSGGNHVCGACLQTPGFLGMVRACAVYEGIVKEAVPLFKYNAKLSLLTAFEPMMADGFLRYFNGSGIDVVMPVPLHKKKLKQRGFNQAYLLVRHLRRCMKRETGRTPEWTLDSRSFMRKKMTLPQTGFDTMQRKQNLDRAFEVTHPHAVKGRHVLLIDDVYTTGATCNEAAKTLLKAGAERVDALVLART